MLNSDQIDVKLVSYSKNPEGFSDFMACIEVVADVNLSRAVFPFYIAEGLEDLMNEGVLDDYFIMSIKRKYKKGEID